MNIGRICSLNTLVIVAAALVLSACGEQTVPITATQAPPIAATSTEPATAAPSPTATELPGTQVLPVTSMAASIPWLPLVAGSEPMSVYYGFNFELPPFNDLLVRKAFAAAVDREQIAQEAAGFKFRNVKPATTMVPSATLGRDLYGEIGIPFDVQQAAAWMLEAGYTDPEAFPPVTLVVYMRGQAAPGAHYRLGQSIARMWEQTLGVQVTVEALETPRLLAGRFESGAPAIYLYAWVGDINDPDNYLRELMHSASAYNHGRFSNARFDELVDRAAGLSDPVERQLLYLEAERILTEQQVGIIPLFHTLRYTQ